MTEIFVNPKRRRSAAPSRTAADGPARAFHRRLPGYEVRPLHAASTLASRHGVGELWIKDESERFGLPAFKILGASWAVYRLLVERLGSEPPWRDLDELRRAFRPLGSLKFVAATDGNHGRAVARMAALLGYEATILVPTGTAGARVAAIESEGARVDIVEGTYDDAVAASAALASADTLVVSDTSWPGYTTVPSSVIEGYATIADEVDEQLDGNPPDMVVVQSGVGALAAAMVDHYAATSTVVVVEPTSAACGLAAARAGAPVAVAGPHRSIMAGLNCGMVSRVAWPRLESGVDVFVAIDDVPAEHAMRELAAIGIVAGETGASGLAGLEALVDARHPAVDLTGARVLVICTEGATDPESYEHIVGPAPRPTATA